MKARPSIEGPRVFLIPLGLFQALSSVRIEVKLLQCIN